MPDAENVSQWNFCKQFGQSFLVKKLTGSLLYFFAFLYVARDETQ